AHVAEAGGDAALGGHGVRAGGEDLGDAGGLQPRLGAAERGAQARAPGAHHHDVVLVLDELVGRHGQTAPPSATLRIETTASAPTRPQTKRLITSSVALVRV